MKCKICNKEESSPFMTKLGICKECYFLARDINYKPKPEDIKEGETMVKVSIGKRQVPLAWKVKQNKEEVKE
jgi:hypothetical protein